jgi:hypothetical protein
MALRVCATYTQSIVSEISDTKLSNELLRLVVGGIKVEAMPRPTPPILHGVIITT